MDPQALIQFAYSYEKQQTHIRDLAWLLDRWLEARDSGDAERIRLQDTRLEHGICRVVGLPVDK